MRTLPMLSFVSLLVPLGLVALMIACGDDGAGFRSGGAADPPDDEYVHNTDDTGPSDPVDTADTGAATTDTGGDSADTGFLFEGTGYVANDVAYNLIAPDQRGVEWRLYQYAGGPVVIVLGSTQDTNFQEASAFLDDIQSDWASQGLKVVTVLLKNDGWLTPTQADASGWAGRYGLPTVLYDDDGSINGTWANYTLMKTYLIDEDMVISWTLEGALNQAQLDDRVHDLIFSKG